MLARMASASRAAIARPAFSRAASTSARGGHSAFTRVAAGVAAFGAGAALATSTVFAADACAHPPHYHWSHTGSLDAFDTASIRRGFIVYQQVCAQCHSVKYLRWRNFVGVFLSEDEAKAMAAEQDVTDGPNDEGEMFERPARLEDPLPNPYPNEEAARAGNAGANPPDLSLIAKARHGHEDYIFALLTGYRDAPEGIELREGLYYNPYFSGGAIGMPPPLLDGAVEYPDGTVATASQMAKDVTTFLAWAAEPAQDERKKLGLQVFAALTLFVGLTGYYKRVRWAPLKTRKITYIK